MVDRSTCAPTDKVVAESDGVGTGELDPVVDAGDSSAVGGEGDSGAVENGAGDFRIFKDVVNIGVIDSTGDVGGGVESFTGSVDDGVGTFAGVAGAVSTGVGSGDSGPGKYFEVSSLPGLGKRFRCLLLFPNFFSPLNFFVLTLVSVAGSSLLIGPAPRFLPALMASMSDAPVVVVSVSGEVSRGAGQLVVGIVSCNDG